MSSSAEKQISIVLSSKYYNMVQYDKILHMA